jgi:hypothetical protein
MTIQEDDEWKEFEEEKKDYTGLKIGNLQIEGEGLPGEGEEEEEQEMEENEAGEMVPKRKVQSGPWKMVSQPQSTAAETSEPQGNVNCTFQRPTKIMNEIGYLFLMHYFGVAPSVTEISLDMWDIKSQNSAAGMTTGYRLEEPE